ncbi:MAG: alanine dehydrogenase [Acidimicrobiaceae bacterium]|nr:alanine dehydrogenase [Acidimicrobiaceae bacterium]MCY4280072.1 alanine dehydrogenase [Acidimicrobiaceae bacterium]MCY4294125.1 alanine dehydrogenase [Acidimicrobiaceae bacterium]
MRIGVPKEIKSEERRVGLTPDSVREVTDRGHEVFVERGAGAGAGFSDDEYTDRGAVLAEDADELFDAGELIVKVKEPQAPERARLRSDHTLFTYLHLAPDPDQARDLIASGATAIAYESVTDERGRLPLLAPMSQVAGRMAIQAGAHCLEASGGGRGVLLGGVPGVAAAPVTVIGGGVVGSNAVQMALGLGADVTVLDRDAAVLESLADRHGPALRTVYSTPTRLAQAVYTADLVVGAVLLPGARAPRLITRQMVKVMRPGTVVVDVAIDQGGCAETSKPTTHADPTFVVDEVVHYCVANMPGAVPRTATQALNNATLSYVLKLADSGVVEAVAGDKGLQDGLNVRRGLITEPAVAEALDLEYTEPLAAL